VTGHDDEDWLKEAKMTTDDSGAKLRDVVDAIGPFALAVSGGVDSMTLAHVAHERLGVEAVMFHALSPAVPSEASARVRRHADARGWRLEVINAGEMGDPLYLENPVNRCFFCKTNLYSRIAGLTALTIASGTNVDDLGDFRPGLEAAKNHRVRHPYVEAGLTKSDVRRVARELGLDDLSELPAAPCLSSRIETGIGVTAGRLALVEAVETALRDNLGQGTIRCRVRHAGVTVELGPDLLPRLDAAGRGRVEAVLRAHGHEGGAAFEIYRQGSAFLRERV
jgi:pyridinium-3,5-biscarboxylic acid mononucleotide sulfurtransferase